MSKQGHLTKGAWTLPTRRSDSNQKEHPHEPKTRLTQTRHGTLNPDDPRPAPFTRCTEKPETLTTCHRHAENPNQHLPLTAPETENGGIGRVSTAHATTDWLALLQSPPHRSRSSVL
jgi:hypothetical protein